MDDMRSMNSERYALHSRRETYSQRMNMKNTNVSNSEIFAMDWAATERRSMLRTLNSGPRPRGFPAGYSSGWGIDVAGTDKRSVKAMLMGKGDLRSTWWKLFSRSYVALVGGGSALENAMYAFHKAHHAATLFRLHYTMSVRRAAADIKARGVVIAIQNCGRNGVEPR